MASTTRSRAEVDEQIKCLRLALKHQASAIADQCAKNSDEDVAIDHGKMREARENIAAIEAAIQVLSKYASPPQAYSGRVVEG